MLKNGKHALRVANGFDEHEAMVMLTDDGSNDAQGRHNLLF